MGIIIYDGVSSDTLGIVIEHPPHHVSPKKDYEIIRVPGRNASIVMDNGSYQNVTRSYDIAIGSKEEDFTPQANRISKWLHSGSGYCRLEDSYESEYFRMAYYEEEADIENILQCMGRVTINFNCKPQCYLKSGENPFTFNPFTTINVINNPTLFSSSPLITIVPHGGLSATISVNNYQIVINAPSGFSRTITIDCETEEIKYSEGLINPVIVNASYMVNLPDGFPRLMPGENYVNVSDENSISVLRILPRWWTV